LDVCVSIIKDKGNGDIILLPLNLIQNGMETPLDLITKFLDEKCTPEEVQSLIEWRQASSENENVFRKMAHQWDCDHDVKENDAVLSKSKVWSNIQDRIENLDNEFVPPSYSKQYLFQTGLVAASVALLIGAFISFVLLNHFPSRQSYTSVEAPSGQKTHILLPDGTKVWLNSESEIIYASDYGRKSRVVRLKGEAFFDVVKNPSHPFIVKSGQVDVKVLGTAFDVSAYPKESFIEVSLVRGSVSVESATDNSQLALLHPNQKVNVNKANLLCSVSDCDAVNESIWTNNQIRFDGVTSEQMFEKLNRWYGVTISAVNMPQNKRYWLILKTESLTETLQLINMITPIKYTIRGEEVSVKFRP